MHRTGLRLGLLSLIYCMGSTSEFGPWLASDHSKKYQKVTMKINFGSYSSLLRFASQQWLFLLVFGATFAPRWVCVSGCTFRMVSACVHSQLTPLLFYKGSLTTRVIIWSTTRSRNFGISWFQKFRLEEYPTMVRFAAWMPIINGVCVVGFGSKSSYPLQGRFYTFYQLGSYF